MSKKSISVWVARDSKGAGGSVVLFGDGDKPDKDEDGSWNADEKYFCDHHELQAILRGLGLRTGQCRKATLTVED